jgi:hypothetical protein
MTVPLRYPPLELGNSNGSGDSNGAVWSVCCRPGFGQEVPIASQATSVRAVSTEQLIVTCRQTLDQANRRTHGRFTGNRGRRADGDGAIARLPEVSKPPSEYPGWGTLGPWTFARSARLMKAFVASLYEEISAVRPRC